MQAAQDAAAGAVAQTNGNGGTTARSMSTWPPCPLPSWRHQASLSARNRKVNCSWKDKPRLAFRSRSVPEHMNTENSENSLSVHYSHVVSHVAGNLLEDDSLLGLLAPTWLPIYTQRLSLPTEPPTIAPRQPMPELSFWFAWTRAPMAAMLSQPHSLKPRQPGKVWSAFHKLNLPPNQKDFIHKALWSRLPVGEHQQARKPLEVWCPVDNELETIQHSLYQCRFF